MKRNFISIRIVETGAGWHITRVCELGTVCFEAYVDDELVGVRETKEEAIDLATDCLGNTAFWQAREAAA